MQILRMFLAARIPIQPRDGPHCWIAAEALHQSGNTTFGVRRGGPCTGRISIFGIGHRRPACHGKHQCQGLAYHMLVRCPS